MEKYRIEFYARQIVDAGYRVHRELGPGLLESVYLQCLAKEFRLRGVDASSEVVLPLFYRGERLAKEFRIDMLVEGEIIIEIKAVDALLPVHTAQLISYMKLAQKKLGFLINFNVPVFKEGIRRYVNNY